MDVSQCRKATGRKEEYEDYILVLFEVDGSHKISSTRKFSLSGTS